MNNMWQKVLMLSVYISVGSPIGTPQIALPLPGDDGHRRYKLGTVQVVSDQKQ